jgi:hypothetical protein
MPLESPVVRTSAEASRKSMAPMDSRSLTQGDPQCWGHASGGVPHGVLLTRQRIVMTADSAARRAVGSGGKVGEVRGEDGDAVGGSERWWC